MIRWKRLFYYLMINIVISACTTLAVLTIWERTHPATSGGVPLLVGNRATSTPPPVLSTFFAGSETPEPSPSPALMTYQVQAGDSLGDIAARFGVPVEEIMRLNGIEDANVIETGTILTIPIVQGHRQTATVENQAPGETDLVDTLTPFPSSSEPRILITNIFGAGDLSTERVRLECRGDGNIDLTNWQLQDEDGNVYPFPQLMLFPGGVVDLYTRPGVNDAAELFWGLDQAVWEPGEVVTLLDAQGNIKATFTVP